MQLIPIGDSCFVQDEYVRLRVVQTLTLYTMSFLTLTTHVSYLVLKIDFCDINSVEDSTFEDFMTCLGSNKPSEFRKILSILSDRLTESVGKYSHMHNL